MLQAIALLLVTSLTLVGLLAAWVATTSRHWFWRAGVFVAVLGLLLLIPAYEPFVAFMLQGAVVAIGVQCYRWWCRRKDDAAESTPGARFSLASLLLVMVFVAVGAAVAVRVPEQNLYAWQSIFLFGLVGGASILLPLWVVHGKSVRWSLRLGLGLGLGLVLMPVISLPLAGGDWIVLSFVAYTSWPPEPDVGISLGINGQYQEGELIGVWAPIVSCVAMISLFVIWMRSVISASGATAVALSSRRSISRRRILLSGLLLVVVFAVSLSPAFIYYRLMTPIPIPVTTLPNPNGWDDLAAAGKLAETSSQANVLSNYDTVTKDQLVTAVAAYASIYEQMKVGLDRQVRYPLDYSKWGMDHLSSMRALARAIAVRSRLAKIEGRYEASAESSLECIRFGYALRRGGLIIESLIGIACSRIGRHWIYDIHEDLSTTQCVSLIEFLSDLETQVEPPEEYILRDRIWSQYGFGWHGHLIQIFDDHMGGSSFYTEDALFMSSKGEQGEMRLLQLELAIQAWRSTYNELPDSLNDLIPQYLDEIPLDPFSEAGSLLQYRRSEDGYVLYSVGYNGTDDGGAAPDEDDVVGYDSGDLRLDIRFGPDPIPSSEEDLEDEQDISSEPVERTEP